MKQTLMIDIAMPTLNELIEAAKWRSTGKGKQWNRYAEIKKGFHTALVALLTIVPAMHATHCAVFSNRRTITIPHQVVPSAIARTIL